VRHLPEPQNLREAVKEVIRSNSADRYHPGRFIQATEAGEAKDLKRICEHMILNPDTLTWLVDALRTHGSLLFLEDLVAEYGYGLSPAAIEEAQRRARALDELVGGGRWKSKAARVVPQAPHPNRPPMVGCVGLPSNSLSSEVSEEANSSGPGLRSLREGLLTRSAQTSSYLGASSIGRSMPIGHGRMQGGWQRTSSVILRISGEP